MKIIACFKRTIQFVHFKGTIHTVMWQRWERVNTENHKTRTVDTKK